MEFSTTPPWWMSDQFDVDTPLLATTKAGPHGVATVYVNPNGSTQPGWGLTGKKGKDGAPDEPGFMHQYTSGRFNSRVTEHHYLNRQAPFAFVMRSVQMVCVDVDGKNDGFANMAQLGLLPPTLAEKSKSGNGLHLFYTTDEPWDDELGFNLFDDQIGIATGIDIRATGCVYHYSTQRWNSRAAAPIPEFLAARLALKKERRVASAAAAETIKEMDDVDKLVAHHELTAELDKYIPAGKRNNTLFAIGSQMKAAGVDGWERLIRDRALSAGLSNDEADKLVSNIATYGV